MLDHVVEELVRTVEAASARLKVLDAGAVTVKPAPGKWSPQEILGHLIDSAANNHHRFVRAQDVEELVFPRYEQDAWVSRQAYQHSDWPVLVDLWRLYNLHLAHVIRHIPEEKLGTICHISPYEPATLGFLVEDYVAHLKHHLGQIGVV